MSRTQTDVLRQHLEKLQAWQNRNLTQEFEMHAAKIALDKYAGAYKDAENFGNGQFVTQKELADLARDQDVIDCVLNTTVSHTVAKQCRAEMREAGRQTGYRCQ